MRARPRTVTPFGINLLYGFLKRQRASARVFLFLLQGTLGRGRFDRVRNCAPAHKKESAISRVLSWATIPLGCASPRSSSDLPGSPCGPHVAAEGAARFPIWSCSRWGLPCRQALPPARCALTAPFHPYRRRLRGA